VALLLQHQLQARGGPRRLLRHLTRHQTQLRSPVLGGSRVWSALWVLAPGPAAGWSAAVRAAAARPTLDSRGKKQTRRATRWDRIQSHRRGRAWRMQGYMALANADGASGACAVQRSHLHRRVQQFRLHSGQLYQALPHVMRPLCAGKQIRGVGRLRLRAGRGPAGRWAVQAAAAERGARSATAQALALVAGDSLTPCPRRREESCGELVGARLRAPFSRSFSAVAL
jgi:hypothetical protein